VFTSSLLLTLTALSIFWFIIQFGFCKFVLFFKYVIVAGFNNATEGYTGNVRNVGNI